jgi:hypothetical protein
MKKPGCVVAAILLLGPPLVGPVIASLSKGGQFAAAMLAVGWLFISIPVSILVFLDRFRRAPAERYGEGVATHYGLDEDLETVEHGPVDLAAALEVTRAVYGRQRSFYESGEEALADTMFGFSRAEGDFIEVCVNGLDNISVTVELPRLVGPVRLETGFRDERTVGSLAEAEAWLERYFTLSHEELRAALRAASL